MILTQDKVRLFQTYKGNVDRWSSGPNANSMSYDEWNLMEDLLRRRLHNEYSAPITHYTEDQILSFCDSPLTAQQLQKVLTQLADPSSIGIVERIVRFFLRSRKVS